jgi:hypothetical protein
MILVIAIIHTRISKKPNSEAKNRCPFDTNIIRMVPKDTSIALEKNIKRGNITHRNIQVSKKELPSILKTLLVIKNYYI